MELSFSGYSCDILLGEKSEFRSFGGWGLMGCYF